jgi:hypothetical protein
MSNAVDARAAIDDLVPDPPRPRWNATPKRILLREQLLKATTPRLTAYYWEAIRALREADDEIRFSVAGHALRELQNGLPHHLEVPEERGRLGDFFNWLRDQWRKLLPSRPPKVNGELWTGLEIDRPLGIFLGTLHQKIETYAGVYVRRREMHRNALGHLDPGLGEAPDAVQQAVVSTWMELSGVFNSATHSTNPEEFEAAVEAFEDFLIDRLAPRTFEKQDAIADLVREAEGRADA